MNYKRIFVGLPISMETTQRILAFEKTKNSTISWIKPGNLHVTILPPIKTAESEIPGIIDRLTKLSNRQKSFDLNFRNIETVFRNRKPRYIWLSANTPPELLHLNQILSKNFIIPKRQEYKTHVTIARLKGDNNEIRFNEAVDWREHVEWFNLYESVPGDGQQNYLIIKSFKLSAK